MARVSLAEGAAYRFRTSDLVDLADGTSLSRAEFDALELQPASPRGAQATRDGQLLLGLDEQTPRPLLSAGARLSSVVDEDRELSPGWHVLVAFVRSGAEIELEVVHFQLELQLPASAREAKCILLAPGGTVLSAPGAPLDLVAAPLTGEVTQFEYFASGSVAGEWRTGGLQTARALGMPSGDHRLGVRCYGATGQLIGRSERTVTINSLEEPSRLQ